MAFDLCFSPEFFFAEGEPYDGLSDIERPQSVWAAIEKIRLEKPILWFEMAIEIFDTSGEYLTPETVLDRVRDTNTCSNLNSPVRVWIDPKGYYTLDVY